jgi:hypothetical protein
MRFTKILTWPKLFALAAGMMAIANPAFAEFEIQEANIEKGEVEIEYRGAYHWGVPEVTNVNENGASTCGGFLHLGNKQRGADIRECVACKNYKN